jgi:hypothetical protein
MVEEAVEKGDVERVVMIEVVLVRERARTAVVALGLRRRQDGNRPGSI